MWQSSNILKYCGYEKKGTVKMPVVCKINVYIFIPLISKAPNSIVYPHFGSPASKDSQRRVFQTQRISLVRDYKKYFINIDVAGNCRNQVFPEMPRIPTTFLGNTRILPI